MAPALDDLSALQVRGVEGKRLIRVESWNRGTAHSAGPETDCATPELS